MTDLTALNAIKKQSATLGQRKVADHLIAFTTACTQCCAVLEDTPSLREVAFDRLSSFLRGNTTVWNPDILFLNPTSASGAIAPFQSLTDALVQAMARAVNPFDHPEQAIYYRHDSVDARHRVAEDDSARIKSIFTQALKVLQQTYHGALAQAWNGAENTPDRPGHRTSRHEVVSRLHHDALEQQIRIDAVQSRLDPEQKQRLLDVLSHRPPSGLFKILVPIPEGRTAPLYSVFAVAQDGQAIEARKTAGAFHLVMPAGGVELCESFADLNSKLARQLSMSLSRERLLKNMYLSDADALPKDFRIGDDDLIYEPCLEPMLHCHVQSLRSKQLADFDYLVAQATAGAHDLQTFCANVGNVQVCAHVDEAMGDRFRSLALDAEQNAQPAWFKHASQDNRQTHARLLEIYRQRKSVVDTLLAGLESEEVFARNEIDRYVLERLGHRIDPQKITISLSDDFNIRNGNFSANYRKTLLEFAMQGLPLVADEKAHLNVPAAQINPALSFAFVKTMIDELDLPRRYRRQLRERYNTEATLRALTHMRDSALALSTSAALLQGHLLNDRSEELVHRVRGDSGKHGAQLTMGALSLTASGTRFKDLLVFRDRAAAGDDHYVLYAPGAPDGRDLFEFTSWRQLAFEIGGWLGSDSGSRYVSDQTLTTAQVYTRDALEDVRYKGTLWNEHSVAFEPLEGQNFEQQLADATRHRVERALAKDDIASLGLNTETSYANRGSLALLQNRIDELNSAFLRTTQDMVSFQAFARREGSKLINDYIRKEGFSETVDTDTVYFDLENVAYVQNPDLSEYTQLRSLTQLFMDGFSDKYEYKPSAPMYSSIGQDLKALPLYFVQFLDKALREAALGERYITWIQDEFLNPDHDRYAYRRALFGRRLQFDMRAAAMREFLQGDLSTEQYQWLVKLIVSLDRQVLEKDPSLQRDIKRSTVSAFRFAGYIVQGVYMLRDFSTADGDFNLLYTPDAPDGVSFRKITDYVELMGSTQMRQYYYLRVPYKGQPSVGSRFDEMDRNIRPQWVSVDNQEYQNPDRVLDIHDLYDVLIGRIITDVDQRTESTAERWTSRAYCVVRVLGSVLLIPFPGASLAWTTLHAAVDVQRGLLAYQDGDRAAASWFFAKALYAAANGSDGALAMLTKGETLVKQVGWWAAGKLAA